MADNDGPPHMLILTVVIGLMKAAPLSSWLVGVALVVMILYFFPTSILITYPKHNSTTTLSSQPYKASQTQTTDSSRAWPVVVALAAFVIGMVTLKVLQLLRKDTAASDGDRPDWILRALFIVFVVLVTFLLAINLLPSDGDRYKTDAPLVRNLYDLIKTELEENSDVVFDVASIEVDSMQLYRGAVKIAMTILVYVLMIYLGDSANGSGGGDDSAAAKQGRSLSIVFNFLRFIWIRI